MVFQLENKPGRILPEGYNGESGSILGRDGERWEVICLPAIAESPKDPLNRKRGDPLWPEWFCRDNDNFFKQEVIEFKNCLNNLITRHDYI